MSLARGQNPRHKTLCRQPANRNQPREIGLSRLYSTIDTGHERRKYRETTSIPSFLFHPSIHPSVHPSSSLFPIFLPLSSPVSVLLISLPSPSSTRPSSRTRSTRFPPFRAACVSRTPRSISSILDDQYEAIGRSIFEPISKLEIRSPLIFILF